MVLLTVRVVLGSEPLLYIFLHLHQPCLSQFQNLLLYCLYLISIFPCNFESLLFDLSIKVLGVLCCGFLNSVLCSMQSHF